MICFISAVLISPSLTIVPLSLTENPRHDVQDPAWSSEDDLFNQYEAQSMVSVQSEKSVENIVQRRSRVSSQENGKYFQCVCSVGEF